MIWNFAVYIFHSKDNTLEEVFICPQLESTLKEIQFVPRVADWLVIDGWEIINTRTNKKFFIEESLIVRYVQVNLIKGLIVIDTEALECDPISLDE